MGQGNVDTGDAEKAQKDEKKNSTHWFGARHSQMILLFILIVIGYGMRVNLSVGIVAMTDPATNPDYEFPTYEWKDKSVILSSFFWGYILPQIGVGQLAKKYGPKWFLTGSMVVSSVFTILIPTMAELGSWGVIVCRVIQGFTQGFIYPCVHNLLSKWIPLNERSRMGTFVYAGGPFGTVISMPLTGWISASSIGWPSVFYIYGALGFIWVAVWTWLGANSPSEDKIISDEEKEYIQKSLGHDDNEQHYPTPWKHIFTSLPLWSILIAHCGQNWGFWTLMTEIPTYMNKVLNFDITQNGLLSATPYFVLWILSFVFSAITDFLINKNILSTGVARKIFTAIGLIFPAVALIALGLVGQADTLVAIVLLNIAVGINSAIFCGYQVNHIDIAPTHAGTLMGITNGVANIFSIIAPLIVQFIVTVESDPEQWKIVFFIASGVYVACCLFYTMFGSGETQYWDKLTSDTKQGNMPEDKKENASHKY